MRQAVAERWNEQPAVVAVVAGEPSVLERANRIADVVADAVGRIDQRLVPVGEEQRRQRMRRMVVGEEELRIGTKSVLREEQPGVEDRQCIGGAIALAVTPYLALLAFLAEPAADGVVDLLVERIFQIVRREERAR
jgi:hypothetical protein